MRDKPRKSGPRKGTTRALPSTPTIKKHIKSQFKQQIKETEQYHKEEAVAWSGKQPWEQWQDEFEQKQRTHVSKFHYPSIHEFALEKSKGKEKVQRWILKSIGPKPKKEINWQGDWALERAFNKSNESIAVIKLEEKIKQDDDVRKLCLPVAASVENWGVDVDLVRMSVLEVLGGSLIEDRPKFKTDKEQHIWEKRQEERLDWYQTWMERLFGYKERIDTLYLRALGVDIFSKNSAQLESAFARIQMLKGFKNVNQIDDGTDHSDEMSNQKMIWQQAITAEIVKARNFDMPLPDEYKPIAKVLEKRRIIPVEAEEVHSKK